MSRNTLTALIAVVCPFIAGSAVAEALQTERDFVTSVGNQIVDILKNKAAPLAARKEDFRRVLRRDFDVPGIGKFVLGRHWRGMSETQRKDYLVTFENALVDTYSKQFDEYQNEVLEVQNAHAAQDGGVIVTSSVQRPAGAPPLRVDWKIFKTPEGPRVLDLIVNGVSMSITQRSEYASLISSRGGVDGLIRTLQGRGEGGAAPTGR